MKLSQIDCFRYTLSLRTPLTLSKQVLKKREGLLIIFYDEQRTLGVGEVSPLPDFSSETLSETLQQILEIKPKLINQVLPQNGSSLNNFLEEWLKPFNLFPSLQFGFEMAALNLVANRKNCLVRDLIYATEHKSVTVCGLLPGPTQNPLTEAECMIKEGFKAIKLKVGRASIKDEIQLIQTLNAKMEGKAILRLDANQKWDINKAVMVGHEIGCAAVEYIEEPFANPSHYETFFMKTTIPIALDESLVPKSIIEVKSLSSVDFLILKPTILGGFIKTWQMMGEAQKFGLNCVISSSFETSLGILALANLAACQRIVHPCGLDTLKWFQNDILKQPLSIENGIINLRPSVKSVDELNLNCLEKINA